MSVDLDLVQLAHSQYPEEMNTHAAALLCKVPIPFAAGFWISKPAGRALIHHACFAKRNNQLVAIGKERERWESFVTEWPAGRRCAHCKEEVQPAPLSLDT